jgi:D-tyrosyl-tRNA(Tyr) deacylase
VKAVIQRVENASVTIDEKMHSAVGKGLVILLGVEKGDTEESLHYLVRKIAQMRIFEDVQGKMNLSIKDIKGEALVVSQFTLLADCQRGNRPSFTSAEEPKQAETMYKRFACALEESGVPVKTGVFGAMMKVSLTNDGPVTIILESKNSLNVSLPDGTG